MAIITASAHQAEGYAPTHKAARHGSVWDRCRNVGSTAWTSLTRRTWRSALGTDDHVNEPDLVKKMPATAFFYGRNPPVDALSQHQQVVVEADACNDLAGLRSHGAVVFAYVSVGEAEGWRPSARALPDHLFPAQNPSWGSRVADLTKGEWIAYLIDNRMADLWAKGYRGFFLDTLDSYRLAFHTPVEQAEQQRALVHLIQEIHEKFPGVRLLINRGFDLLPRVHHLVSGLVVESLFQTWNPATQAYGVVEESGRAWLLDQLRQVTDGYGIPVTIIDYVDPAARKLISETAQRIEALGYAAWIASPGLDTLYKRTSA